MKVDALSAVSSVMEHSEVVLPRLNIVYHRRVHCAITRSKQAGKQASCKIVCSEPVQQGEKLSKNVDQWMRCKYSTAPLLNAYSLKLDKPPSTHPQQTRQSVLRFPRY